LSGAGCCGDTAIDAGHGVRRPSIMRGTLENGCPATPVVGLKNRRPSK
jgi:hypothetical protein